MFDFSKFDKHAGLVGRMAKVLGVDLVDAALRGAVQPQAIRTAVISCTACKNADGCARWLDEHAQGANAAPPICRNSAMLNALARR